MSSRGWYPASKTPPSLWLIVGLAAGVPGLGFLVFGGLPLLSLLDPNRQNADGTGYVVAFGILCTCVGAGLLALSITLIVTYFRRRERSS